MSRLDVLYVISSLAIGGSERHLSALASALARRGHKVEIHCLYAKGPFAKEPEQSGVRVLGPLLSTGNRPLGRFMRAAQLPFTILRLYGLMLFRRPAISHFFGPPAYLIGGVLALGAGLRRLVVSRRCMNNYQDAHPRLASFEHRLHARMSVVLGNSLRVVDQLMTEEEVPPERLGLIYNGIDLKPFSAGVDRVGLRAGLATGGDDLVLAILANLIPYKGHADLFEALAGIEAQLPANWKLWIIGSDDGVGPALKRLGAERGLTEHLRFLGVQSDVQSLLMSADIAVSASHQEGFSNAILEAMAASLPVVATDVGGNKEAVVDGLTGFVVPARDSGAMGAALLKLAADKEAAAAMGKAGRQSVEKEFSLEACVARYEALYEAIRAGRPLAQVAGVHVRMSADATEEHATSSRGLRYDVKS